MLTTQRPSIRSAQPAPETPIVDAMVTLSTNSQTYELSRNMTFAETGFLVAANSVTIDLKGFSITYNNAAPQTVTNGDFTNATAGVPDNWDVSLLGSYTHRNAAGSWLQYPSGLYGSKVIRVALPAMAGGTCTAATGNPCEITTSSAHGLSTGDYVILGGGFIGYIGGAGYGFSVLNGGYKITVTSTTKFTVAVNVTSLSVASGTWRKAVVLISDAVTIPTANRLYAATFQPAGDPSLYPSWTGAIGLIDASSGAQQQMVWSALDQTGSYSNNYENNGSRNSAPVFVSKPANTNNLKVIIYLCNETAGSMDVDIGRVRVSAAYDTGINAGGGTSQWPPAENYSGIVYGKAAFTLKDSVGGGTIIQGANRGFRGHGCTITGITGTILVDAVDFTINGDDSVPLQIGHFGNGAPSATSVEVKYCDIIYASGVNVTHRFYGLSAIMTGEINGQTLIHHNTLTDIPWQAFSLNKSANYAGSTHNEIHHNNVYPKCVAANGYTFAATSYLKAYDNVVDASAGSGRGFYIAAGPGRTVAHVEYYNNTVTVRDTGDREVQLAGSTRAIRIRNQEDGPATTGVLLDISVHNNTFAAIRNGSGQLSVLHGGRISVILNAGMDASQYNISNNVFKAIDDVGGGTGTACEIGAWENGVATLLFDGNVLESNFCSLQFCGNDDDQGVGGIRLTNNEIIKSALGASMTFVSIKAGDSTDTLTNTWLINTTFTNCTSVVSWSSSTAKDLSFGWVLTTSVTSGGSPAAGESVTIVDSATAAVASGSTNASGVFVASVPTERRNWNGSSQSVTSLTPATVTVRSSSQTPTLTANGSVSFTF
jgi:hypothetical protein